MRHLLAALAKWETRWSLKRRERVTGHSSRCVSSRVCSPATTLFHKKGPRHRRKICVNPLWLYSYNIQSSSSKNKDINYIFIYLRVFRWLYSGAICDNAGQSWVIKNDLISNVFFWLLYITKQKCLTCTVLVPSQDPF